jgi:predicted DNA-binding transcriptional regulator AlpA
MNDKLTGNKLRNAEARERRHRTQPRRGLSLVEAATYLGIGPAKFEELMAKGLLPKPRLIGAVQSWDIDELDQAYERFPHKERVEKPPSPAELERRYLAGLRRNDSN